MHCTCSHAVHTHWPPKLFLRLAVAGGKTKTNLRGERATGSFRFRLKIFTINLNTSQLRPMLRPVRMRTRRMTSPAGHARRGPTARDGRRRPLETKNLHEGRGEELPTKKGSRRGEISGKKVRIYLWLRRVFFSVKGSFILSPRHI